jgi:hypothetical protein
LLERGTHASWPGRPVADEHLGPDIEAELLGDISHRIARRQAALRMTRYEKPGGTTTTKRAAEPAPPLGNRNSQASGTGGPAAHRGQQPKKISKTSRRLQTRRSDTQPHALSRTRARAHGSQPQAHLSRKPASRPAHRHATYRDSALGPRLGSAGVAGSGPLQTSGPLRVKTQAWHAAFSLSASGTRLSVPLPAPNHCNRRPAKKCAGALLFRSPLLLWSDAGRKVNVSVFSPLCVMGAGAPAAAVAPIQVCATGRELQSGLFLVSRSELRPAWPRRCQWHAPYRTLSAAGTDGKARSERSIEPFASSIHRGEELG